MSRWAVRLWQVGVGVVGLLTLARTGLLYATSFPPAGRNRVEVAVLAGWYVGPIVLAIGASWLSAWRVGRRAPPVLLPLPINLVTLLAWAWLPCLGLLSRLSAAETSARPLTPLVAWDAALASVWPLVAVSLVALALGAAWSVTPIPLLPLATPRPWRPWVVELLAPHGRAWHPAVLAGWVGLRMAAVSLAPVPGFAGWALWRGPWPELWATRRSQVVLMGALCASSWI